MEEENKKRPMYDGSSHFSDKMHRTPRAKSEDTQITNDGDIMALFPVDEETLTELWKLLETEITSPPLKVKFINNPYSSPEIFQYSTSFITINGNEESCGSSYSDLHSSVMANIDFTGISRDTLVGDFRKCDARGCSGMSSVDMSGIIEAAAGAFGGRFCCFSRLDDARGCSGMSSVHMSGIIGGEAVAGALGGRFCSEEWDARAEEARGWTDIGT
ncbi:hypothetical protein LguiA_020125 [Lonicera macranthoides]